jgi:regulator of chromosome condensation
LGRQTDKVPDPNNAEHTLDRDVLESTPDVIQALVDCNFRAVRVAAGDSVSLALSDEGRVKYWGSFRVRRCDDRDKQFVSIDGITDTG